MATFRELHRPGTPFVLANAWDLGSARLLAALGAKALATSSAAHAFTLGLPDGGSIPREVAIAHAATLAAATPLPVSADLENGYGDDPAEVAATVRAAAAAGLAGVCLEDTALPSDQPYPRAASVARIEAAAAAARDERAADPARDVFLVARADGLMLGHYDLDEAIARVREFARVGADGVYIPLLPDLDAVRRVCAAVDVPVNVLAAGPMLRTSLADLAAAGVARVSLGSTLARRTHRVVIDAARDLFERGSFAGLLDGSSSSEVDPLLARGAGISSEGAPPDRVG